MPSLNDKQGRFVDEYLIDLNATQAAIRAGYSEKTAGQQGERLLKNVEIQKSLTDRMKKRAERTEITQDYVLASIVETMERCKQAEPVLTPQGIPTGEYKFEHVGVLRGADLLGRHLGMWKQRFEHTGKDGAPLVPPQPIDLDQFKEAMRELKDEV
jgi:phage terminase small subunit